MFNSSDTYDSTSRPRWIIYVTALVLLAFGLWAGFSEIDQVSRAQGQVIASARTQSIQSADGGVLEELLVREGQAVKKGDVLAVLDRSRAEAAYKDIQGKVAVLRTAMVRLQSEVYGKPLNFGEDLQNYPEYSTNQRALYERRRATLQEELQSLNKMRDLAQSELNMNLPLLKTGDVAKTDIVRMQRQVAEIEGQMTNRKTRFFQEAQAEMTKVEEDLNSRKEELNDKTSLLERTQLKAPTNGLVKNISVTTIGGVLRPSEEVMQLVPTEGDLIVEAEFKPADMAFVREGMPAKVKLDAYDYTIYGVLEAKVTYISPDALKKQDPRAGADQNYYRVRITVDPNQNFKRKGKNLEIQPGMTSTVEVMTGRQSILRYLTKPLVKTMSESMGER